MADEAQPLCTVTKLKDPDDEEYLYYLISLRPNSDPIAVATALGRVTNQIMSAHTMKTFGVIDLERTLSEDGKTFNLTHVLVYQIRGA